MNAYSDISSPFMERSVPKIGSRKGLALGLASICLFGAYLCFAGDSSISEAFSFASKPHTFKVRYYLNVGDSFSPRWVGSEVIKIGAGEHNILRASTLNQTQHVFGFRVSQDDAIQAYIKVDGQAEISGEEVDRDDDLTTTATVNRTNA